MTLVIVVSVLAVVVVVVAVVAVVVVVVVIVGEVVGVVVAMILVRLAFLLGVSGEVAARLQGLFVAEVLQLFVRRFHSASNSSLSVTVMLMSRRPLTL